MVRLLRPVRKWPMRHRPIKNARQRWSGVFLCLLFFSISGWGVCPVPAVDEWAELASVVDGDTVRLTDGRRVRLIAINTPELGHGVSPDQPLAVEAKRAVEQFFAADRRVGLLYGAERQDHYGRTLAHLFRADGQSLGAELLVSGLGWRIVIPPNLKMQDCFAEQERLAHRSDEGVWSAYPEKHSESLASSDRGFGLVRGRVQKVVESKSGWWVELPGLSLRIKRGDIGYFGVNLPNSWLGRELLVRGWIVDRAAKETAWQRPYPRYFMVIRHPGVVEMQ